MEANSSYRECVQPVRSSVPGLPENQFFEVAGINQQLIARPANGHKPDRVCKRRAQPIAVYGYTDDIGTQTYNLQLSRRRAEAVRDFLVQTGISPTIISTKGFGKSDPRILGNSEQARAANRRVEIAIVDSKVLTNGLLVLPK